jgi:hypothetical protein
MIIFLNGWPGVGKLTVARHLVVATGGRLLDAHTIYNVAFYLTEFRTPAFYETVRGVRDIAFARVAELPPFTPVVMTNAFAADSDWALENWKAVRVLADRRGSKLFFVELDCSPDENKRRIQFEARGLLGKPRNPSLISENRQLRSLLRPKDADHLLCLDNTSLSPEACAREIGAWVASCQSSC